jgi:DNA-binding MarR family transcriptional regulator
MWPGNMRPLSIEVEASEFRRDADGCLYDPRMRQLLVATGRKVNPGTEALAAVRFLGKKMHAAMERWADRHGLSEGRFQILVRLQHVPDGRCTMGDLAAMLDVSPRTITGLVDNLVRDGLVRRVDDTNDRRSVYAEVTEQGRERVKALWRDAITGQQALTRGFKDAELVQLRHMCLRMIEAMGAEEEKSHATS